MENSHTTDRDGEFSHNRQVLSRISPSVLKSQTCRCFFHHNSKVFGGRSVGSKTHLHTVWWRNWKFLWRSYLSHFHVIWYRRGRDRCERGFRSRCRTCSTYAHSKQCQSKQCQSKQWHQRCQSQHYHLCHLMKNTQNNWKKTYRTNILQNSCNSAR